MSCGYRREGDWRGVLSMVWFLKKKPSLVGMVTLLPSKVIPSLVQAANSKHLLPEAMATRKMVLSKRSSREAELFRNLVVWRVSKAWLRAHLGIFFCAGGERWNCALASSEKSLSAKLMSKASLKGMERECLYPKIVLGDSFLLSLRNTRNSKTFLFLRTARCSGSQSLKALQAVSAWLMEEFLKAWTKELATLAPLVAV